MQSDSSTNVAAGKYEKCPPATATQPIESLLRSIALQMGQQIHMRDAHQPRVPRPTKLLAIDSYIAAAADENERCPPVKGAQPNQATRT